MTAAAALPMNGLPSRTLAAGFDLLAGIRVLDLTTSIAGPYAGMLLADLGAEVIKVERPGRGDDCRAWGPPFLDGESLWFLSVNRNKRSITLDYSGAAGRAVLHELARKCDVVLVNLVARAQRKLGIDHATLSALTKADGTAVLARLWLLESRGIIQEPMNRAGVTDSAPRQGAVKSAAER